MITATEAFDLCVRLASLSAAVLSAETLLDRRHYRDDGLLGWQVMRIRHRRLVSSWFAPALGILMSYRWFLGLAAVRLAAAVILLAGVPVGGFRAAILAVLAAAGYLSSVRNSYGKDGADQMNHMTLSVLAVGAMVGSPVVEAAVLWFLALELVLSYTAAGVAKMRGKEWRSGRAPWGVLSTRMYGLPALGRFLRSRPRLSWMASWSVILLETVYPLVFIAPRTVAASMVAAGIGFHVFTATVMGLNTFLLSFISAYPALVWLLFGR